MSHCTTTPITTPITAPVASDRRSQAQAIRTTLDHAAAGINAFHAQVLAAVIEMKTSGLHRSEFGFSALRDLLLSQFDFTFNTAGSIAAIARLSGKFALLAEAAVSGKARIDQVAFAVRQLDKTTPMRLFARTPFKTPAPSPFDPEILCATPEAMVAEYCAHASFKDLQRHLDELWASIAEEAELLDELGAQSLQRLELMPQDNGMWSLSAELSDTTGRLLDKYLQTACPPPRQEDQDSDGLLPPREHRNAEALHQLLAGYGSSPQAATRHGHTATLDLTVDIETLQGKDTGRLPLLEGDPITVARARLLACEGVVIPSVFNYAKGEAVELGRALRLPNTALRRKLELEQPGGCAWSGCGRPVAWTEAHHIQHWADGGPTVAENLILLCRFHHGRIHTTGWSVEKTGPGQAVITHHDGHDTTSAPTDTAGCGCSDWRTDQDMDAEHAGTDWDVFPTGLYRSEWSETMKPDLDALAEAIDRDRALQAMRAARAKCREKFGKPNPTSQASQATPPPPPPPSIVKAPKPSEPIEAPKAPKIMAGPDREVDYGEPPFLLCPQRATAEGKRRNTKQRSPTPIWVRAPHHAQGRNPPRQDPDQARPRADKRAPPSTQPFVAARLNHKPPRHQSRRTRPGSSLPVVAARPDRKTRDPEAEDQAREATAPFVAASFRGQGEAPYAIAWFEHALAFTGADPPGEGFGPETTERLRRLTLLHLPAIVADMRQREIVRLLADADADAGRAKEPIRAGGYAVVTFSLRADSNEEDRDLAGLALRGSTSTAAEAFDLLGDTMAHDIGDDVDDLVADELGIGVEVNDFDQWFEGDEAAIALLKSKPTNGRKMLMFLLYGYYAPMNDLDARTQPYDRYLGAAAKLFTGARAHYGASAAPPHFEDGMVVFELQPTDREDGPNSLDDRGMSPLHHAVAQGDFPTVTALLEAGADPNLQSEYGNSPLFAAIDHRGHTSSVLEAIDSDRWAVTRALLDHGARTNSRDRLGRTLVDLAAQTLPYPAAVIEELHVRGGQSFMLKPEEIRSRLECLYFDKLDWFQVRLNEIRYLLENGAERRGLLHHFFGTSGWWEDELSGDQLVAVVGLLLSQGVRDEEIDGKTAGEHARKWLEQGFEHYQAAIDLIEANTDQPPLGRYQAD